MIQPRGILKADPIETERGTDWRERAACIGQWDAYDAVLDRSKDDDARRDAEAICAPCPVKAECAAFRNRHRLSGTWGGTTNTWRTS